MFKPVSWFTSHVSSSVATYLATTDVLNRRSIVATVAPVAAMHNCTIYVCYTSISQNR